MAKKQKVYVIRGKNGEYAPSTKISTSKSGAKNSCNRYCDDLLCRAVSSDPRLGGFYNPWKWWDAKNQFSTWDNAERYLWEIGTCLTSTEQDYNDFMSVVDKIYSYWTVEEIEQDEIEF